MHPLEAQVPIEILYNNALDGAKASKSAAEWTELGYNSVIKWVEDRNKCYSDLFWFATEMLGYDLVEFHRLITTDFFLKKDPTIAIENLSTIKSRLVLYPRGSFKSSIDEQLSLVRLRDFFKSLNKQN
jgi:hypothetical protein